MKVISYRKGFITNSSASNFWFVLEKNQEARDELAEQIGSKYPMDTDEVKNSISIFLENRRELIGKNHVFWHKYMGFRRDTHDKVPEFGFLRLPAFGLDFVKISKIPQDEFDSIITALGKIDWSDWLYRTLEISNKTTERLIKIIEPIARENPEDWDVTTAYSEMIRCAENMDEPTLCRYVRNLLWIYDQIIFDIERMALVNVFYTFLERAAESKNFEIGLTKARRTSEKFVSELEKSYMESTGFDFKSSIPVGRPTVWDRYLISNEGSVLRFTPILDTVDGTESFLIFPSGDKCPGLRAMIKCSDMFGLRDAFEDLIKKSAEDGHIDGRIANLLLLRGERYMNEKIW